MLEADLAEIWAILESVEKSIKFLSARAFQSEDPQLLLEIIDLEWMTVGMILKMKVLKTSSIRSELRKVQKALEQVHASFDQKEKEKWNKQS